MCLHVQLRKQKYTKNILIIHLFFPILLKINRAKSILLRIINLNDFDISMQKSYGCSYGQTLIIWMPIFDTLSLQIVQTLLLDQTVKTLARVTRLPVCRVMKIPGSVIAKQGFSVNYAPVKTVCILVTRRYRSVTRVITGQQSACASLATRSPNTRKRDV